MSGTYTLDLENKKITLKYKSVGSVSPQIAKNGNTISILYDADKFLNFLTSISAVSTNATVASLNTLLKSYEGLLIGIELQK